MTTSSKKSKPSTKSGGSPRSYSEIYKNSAATAAPIDAGPATSTAAAATMSTRDVVLTTSDEVDWRGEYGYVIDDLKRLGIVTAIIAGGIIVVGLFI